MLNKCFTGEKEYTDKNLSADLVMGAKNIFYILGWYGSYKLLIYQYRKGLSETWYSHQAFWVLNFLTQLYLLIYSFENGYYNKLAKVLGVLCCLTNLSLVIFMFKTTKRTIDRPRPADIHFTSDGNLIEQMDNG